jgi:hypothetical protein
MHSWAVQHGGKQKFCGSDAGAERVKGRRIARRRRILGNILGFGVKVGRLRVGSWELMRRVAWN